MPKSVRRTVSLARDLVDRVEAIATRERRSLAGQMEVLVSYSLSAMRLSDPRATALAELAAEASAAEMPRREKLEVVL